MDTFPSKLSDYLIQGELGRGSYGVVYRVQSKIDGQVYVMKKINVTVLSQKHKNDALKEVQILKLLNHPHIVKYYTSFVEDNTVNIIMEFAEGGDLHRLLRIQREKQRHFSEKEIWRYAFELASAIAYLHENNIIHRDIKCMNVLLSRERRVKLGDLGASKMTETAAMHLTRVGTPLYLAPELVRQTPYDFKVDVWALGCVLYLLTSFEAPFQGDNLIALGNAIVSKRPKPIPPMYSPKLSSLIFRLLEKKPKDRPTISEVISLIHSNSRAKFDLHQSMEDLSTNFTLLKEIKEEGGVVTSPRNTEDAMESPVRSPRLKQVHIPEHLKDMIEQLERPIVRPSKPDPPPLADAFPPLLAVPPLLLQEDDTVKPVPVPPAPPASEKIPVLRPKTARVSSPSRPSRSRLTVRNLQDQEGSKPPLPLVSVLRRSESSRIETTHMIDAGNKGLIGMKSNVVEPKEPMVMIGIRESKVSEEDKQILRRIFEQKRSKTAVNRVRIAEKEPEVVEIEPEECISERPVLKFLARPMSAVPKSNRLNPLFKPPKLQALLQPGSCMSLNSDCQSFNSSRKRFGVKDLLNS